MARTNQERILLAIVENGGIDVPTEDIRKSTNIGGQNGLNVQLRHLIRRGLIIKEKRFIEKPHGRIKKGSVLCKCYYSINPMQKLRVKRILKEDLEKIKDSHIDL